MSVLLHELSLLATSLELDPLDGSFRMEHVDECEKTLHEIKTRLDRVKKSASSSGKLRSIVEKVKWPYSNMEFQKLLADLSRHKETMALALLADSMKGLLQILSKQSAISDGIVDIRDTVRETKIRILVDAQRQKVLDFFLTVNPQINLETSLRLRHPMAVLWLTESKELKQWLSRPNAKLWMSGIPGAGKTVLAGSVIEKALRLTAHLKSEATCFPSVTTKIRNLTSLATSWVHWPHSSPGNTTKPIVFLSSTTRNYTRTMPLPTVPIQNI
jgi:hypothetical protein